MKIRLLFLLAILTSSTLLAQNLVINPSFELTSSNCANLGGEGFGTDLLNWDNANSNTAGDSCSSPDLFSACNVLPFIGGPSPTNMPNSFLGFQRSRTGTRHAGLITYGPGLAAGCTAIGNDNYREYIQGHTTTPLAAGQTYCVSMYVSLGDGVVWATNNIGVRFQNNQYLRDACAGTSSLINLTPQLNYTCAAITDTVNWVRLQWNYTAVGGEQYFIIGNFYNNANTTIGCSNSAQALINPYAYYYIDDVSITANSCCAATILPQASVCPTDAPYNLVATPPLGTSCNPTVSGTWSGPGITNGSAGTFDPSVAGIGTHTITYILTCGTTVTTTIVVSNCATLNVCQQPGGNLTVTGGTAPYQWQSPSQVTDCSSCFLGQCFPPICSGTTSTVYTTFASTPTATPPGTLPFRVIDNAGNSQEITTLSGIPPCACPFSVATTSTQATCGTANGVATVNATGTTGNTTYLWSYNNLTTPSISGLGAGTYTVTVTNNGCTTTSSVTINQSPAVTLSSTSANTTCGNTNGSASVTVLTGNGPLIYAWNSGEATAGITNKPAGNYTVTVTAAGGCTATQSFTIAPSTGITVTPTTTNANCNQNDGTASVNAVGGNGNYTYQWSNNLGSNNSVSGVATGNYTVVVSDGTCSTTQAVAVGQNTSMTSAINGTPAGCINLNSGTINLNVSGGTPGYSYSWSNGDTTQNISGLSAGPYTVTITDGSGCIITNNYNVAAPNTPTGSVDVIDESCKDVEDGSINLTVTGGTGPYTYLWNTNDTTQNINNLAGGTYTVTITDAAGCTTTQSPIVAPGIEFPITITQSGDTLFASAAPNYLWYLNGQPIFTATGQTYIVTQSGTYTVSTNVDKCKFGSNQIVITGIDEFTNFATINVFPNPASDNITVSIQLKTPQKVVLTLVDVLGRKVSTTANDTKANTFQFNLSVKEIGAGIYFLNISTENESKSVKVVKN